MNVAALVGNRLLVEIFLLLLCPSCALGSAPDLLLRMPAEKEQIRQMLGYINQLRIQHGLSSLKLDPRLSQAAKQHAEDMAR